MKRHKKRPELVIGKEHLLLLAPKEIVLNPEKQLLKPILKIIRQLFVIIKVLLKCMIKNKKDLLIFLEVGFKIVKKELRLTLLPQSPGIFFNHNDYL